MSPRLLLQPTVASLLALVICLACLAGGGRAVVAVPPLIALWANLDAWFILGPAMVALFWLGHRLGPPDPGWPRWLFPAALLAGLANPHHVHAFQLPFELSPDVWASGFVADPRFSGLFASPWRWAFVNSATGFNPAAGAFFALLIMGLFSFAVTPRSAWGWRATVWLPFAALACWQTRLIPFFAVVAAPITALNLRGAMPATAFPRSGRAFALGLTAVFIALGWFGWLQGVHVHDRAAAWRIHTDPSLAHTATQLPAVRAAAGPGRVFVTHPDLAHYVAWFAPGERYTIDSRLGLLTNAAGRYEDESRAVGLLPGGVAPIEGVAAVAYYDPDPARSARGLAAAAAPGGPWRLAGVTGGAVLMPNPATRVNAGRPTVIGDFSRAENGPPLTAELPRWWEATHRNRGREGSWEADASTTLVRAAERDPTVAPAVLLTAVRAGRVGAERDPVDAVAWGAVGRASLALAAWEGSEFTLLERVRNLQATAALTQAVALSPDALADHDTLGRLHARTNRLDLALRHVGIARDLLARAGPAGDPAGHGARLDALTDAARELHDLVQEAENRFLVRGAGLSANPAQRARIAAELGLFQKAVDLILASHPDLYGTAGLTLLADLLLQSGRAAECRTLLDRNELRRNPAALGYINLLRQPNPDGSPWPYRLPAYDWLDLCQAATAGRYLDAGAAAERLADQFEAAERSIRPAVTAGGLAALVREVGLAAPPSPVLAVAVALPDRLQLTDALRQTKLLAVTRADVLTLAGVLEAERGGPAAGPLATAAGLYHGGKGFALSLPGQPTANRYNALLPLNP